ncbi:MAG: YjbQ family protein, partial [Candidatus Aenigmatarchaeota archaeon]
HDSIDDNAHSHIKSILAGTDRTVPVTDGSLDLGRWQDILFIETDGPRSNRKVIVKTLGEK